MTSFHTYAQASAVRAQAQPAANPTRLLLPVVLLVALLAALLPTDAAPVVALVRETTLVTTAAIGIPSSLLSILLYHTGQRDALGYLCVPVGLTAGAVAAAVSLAQNLPLASPIASSGLRTH